MTKGEIKENPFVSFVKSFVAFVVKKSALRQTQGPNLRQAQGAG